VASSPDRPVHARPPVRRRGPYAKTAARRLETIAAAADAFGESGYESASIRDIADRLGITHAAVTFHFNTKQQLLAAVLEHQQEALRPVLEHAAESRCSSSRSS
jgi:AcrR family transcriptional regulator